MTLRIQSRFGFTGAVIGGAAAVTVGIVMTINSDPSHDSWQLALVGVLAAPVLLALVASFRADPGTRGILLLAAALSSLFFMVLGTLGPLFFPPAILLFVGAAKAFGESQLSFGEQVLRPAVAAAAGVLMVGAVFALYTSDDPRCATLYSNGVAVGSSCTSDVVTAREAGQGLLVSAAGSTLAGLAASGLRGKPQPAPI